MELANKKDKTSKRSTFPSLYILAMRTVIVQQARRCRRPEVFEKYSVDWRLIPQHLRKTKDPTALEDEICCAVFPLLQTHNSLNDAYLATHFSNYLPHKKFLEKIYRPLNHVHYQALIELKDALYPSKYIFDSQRGLNLITSPLPPNLSIESLLIELEKRAVWWEMDVPESEEDEKVPLASHLERVEEELFNLSVDPALCNSIKFKNAKKKFAHIKRWLARVNHLKQMVANSNRNKDKALSFLKKIAASTKNPDDECAFKEAEAYWLMGFPHLGYADQWFHSWFKWIPKNTPDHIRSIPLRNLKFNLLWAFPSQLADFIMYRNDLRDEEVALIGHTIEQIKSSHNNEDIIDLFNSCIKYIFEPLIEGEKTICPNYLSVLLPILSRSCRKRAIKPLHDPHIHCLLNPWASSKDFDYAIQVASATPLGTYAWNILSKITLNKSVLTSPACTNLERLVSLKNYRAIRLDDQQTAFLKNCTATFEEKEYPTTYTASFAHAYAHYLASTFRLAILDEWIRKEPAVFEMLDDMTIKYIELSIDLAAKFLSSPAIISTPSWFNTISETLTSLETKFQGKSTEKAN